MNKNPAAGDQISKLGAEPILLTRLTRRKASVGLFLFGAGGVLMAHRVHGELPEDSGTWTVRQEDTTQLFQKLADKEPEERMKEHQAYRQKAHEKRAAFLEELLKDEQLKRLRQLELQQEGPMALFARPDLGKELKITDEQWKQFMALLEEQQKKIEALMKEAQSGGNPQEFGPKIVRIPQGTGEQDRGDAERHAEEAVEGDARQTA